jgi:hypothetical protein
MLRDAILFEIGIAELGARELSSMLSANVEMGLPLARTRRKMKGSKQTGEAYHVKGCVLSPSLN